MYVQSVGAKDGANTLVWATSTNYNPVDLNQATLPIAKSDSNFVVTIEARRRPKSAGNTRRVEEEGGRVGGGGTEEEEETDAEVLLDDADFTFGLCAVQPVLAAVAATSTDTAGDASTPRPRPDSGYVVEQSVTLSPVRENGDNSATTTAPVITVLITSLGVSAVVARIFAH